jgi:putative membrane protein
MAETKAVMALSRRLGLLLAAVAVYCLAAGLIIRWWNIRLVEWGSAASLLNTLILGLLMGFRNRAAYDRWWEARSLWGKLTNDTRNVAAKLAAFLPAELLVRSRTAELLAGFAVALKRHLRDETPRLRELPGLEHEQADPPHVPLYVAKRLYGDLGEWHRAGHVDGSVLWALDTHLRGLLDVCGGCEKIHNTPLSPSYKMLLRVGLFMNILAEPWLSVPEMGLWGLPAFMLVCFFLLGVELIDSVVEDPFAREYEDLHLEQYCRTIREGVEASLAGSTDSPVIASNVVNQRSGHHVSSCGTLGTEASPLDPR